MIMKFLIKDNLTIKTYKENILIDICPIEELTIETFENHGIDLGDLPNLTELRKTLEETTLKLLYISEEEIKLYYREYGLPHGQFMEMATDANISMDYVLFVKTINITANPGIEADILRFIISLDKGLTWVTYYNNQWIPIERIDIEVIEKGLSLEAINSLEQQQLEELTAGANSIKFCWYMRKSDVSTPLEVSNIYMKYETNI